MNTLNLGGCVSKPLSSYLKALGVFRLISEQIDPSAKGYWINSTFGLNSILDKDELEEFFAARYRPTPLVAPWNGGSGFFPGDNISGIKALVSSSEPRFQMYRAVIQEIRSWPEMAADPVNVDDVLSPLRSKLARMSTGSQRSKIESLIITVETMLARVTGNPQAELSLSVIEKTSKDIATPNRDEWSNLWKTIKKARTEIGKTNRTGNKEDILKFCRNRLPDEVLAWIDAAYVVTTEKSVFSPILGTGGNEGRLDFTNNFMQRIAETLIDKELPERKNLLRNALWGIPVKGLKPTKIGQFDPGKAGGFNQGMGVETKDIPFNPWDFIFTLEGALLLAGALARRSPSDARAWLSAPFSVYYSAVGFGSSTSTEQGRGEIWLPLWREPAGLPEMKQVFSEGRSVVGRRPSRTGLEFSRAVSTLGVDRGIEAFERYAFLERRGQSYVALPAGRFTVKDQPQLELLGELDRPLRQLDCFLREFDTIPASYANARRQIDEAMFSCTIDANHLSFRELVRSLGRMEQLMATRDRSKKPVLARPLFGLSPRWVGVCGVESPEVRIASALASIQSTGKVGPLRANMAGTDVKSSSQWGEGSAGGRWVGNDLCARLANTLARRVMEAERCNAPYFPGWAKLKISPYDVMGFLYKETDDNELEELLWGFMLIDWNRQGLAEVQQSFLQSSKRTILSRTWCLLKLLHIPGLVNGKKISMEPRISQLLTANRCDEACSIAVRRLRVSQTLPVNISFEEVGSNIRLIASLLIPTYAQQFIESMVLKPAVKK